MFWVGETWCKQFAATDLLSHAVSRQFFPLAISDGDETDHYLTGYKKKYFSNEEMEYFEY